jgi:hypothetical protein
MIFKQKFTLIARVQIFINIVELDEKMNDLFWKFKELQRLKKRNDSSVDFFPR